MNAQNALPSFPVFRALAPVARYQAQGERSKYATCQYGDPGQFQRRDGFVGMSAEPLRRSRSYDRSNGGRLQRAQASLSLSGAKTATCAVSGQFDDGLWTNSEQRLWFPSTEFASKSPECLEKQK